MGQGQSAPTPSSSTTASQLPQAPHPLPPNADPSSASACPVDHKSREAWLKAATQQQQQSSSSSQSSPPLAPHPLPPGADASSASACPVDHKSREAWLKASQRQPTAQGEAPPTSTPIRPKLTNSRLSTHREISTIPRGYLSSAPPAKTDALAAQPSPPPPSPYITTSSTTAHGASATTPANSETSTATDIHTSSTGHWVYPSEAMFYSAMQRKSFSPRASDMSSIIPIHNAVNERTWYEILRWERGRGSETCGGPRLVSFQGDATKLTPRAWWLSSVWGYQKPFDRHDWVVDRCGTKVEYVIDFYEGKQKREDAGPGPSFYLDVRPKLNSVEGVKMRMQRFLGFD